MADEANPNWQDSIPQASPPKQPRPRRVAVIAVHGVGDQMPCETAHRIGDLLQDLNVGQMPGQPPPAASSQLPVYYPFHEETIRLDVRPTVVLNPHSPKMVESRGPFNTWVKERLKRSKTVEGDGIKDDDIWYEFTKGQLSAYRGDDPEDTYPTIRMEGTRAQQGQQKPVDVHVYELYWADLSRLKAGVFSIFTELYQLLFHLPSLGTHTVNAATLHHPTPLWRIFRNLQTYTAGILTVPIPILNLLVLGMIVMVVTSTSLRNADAEGVLLAIAMGGMVVVGLGWLIWRRLTGRLLNPWVWVCPLPLVGVTAWYAFVSVPSNWSTSIQRIATGMTFVIVGLLLFLVLGIYDRRRPGALKWAGRISLVAIGTGFLSVCLVPPDPDHRSEVIMFWVRQFEVIDVALLSAWLMFFVLGLGTFVVGALATIRTRKIDKLAHRSRWTGLLMLSLPALAFLIVTVGAWYLVAGYVPRLLPDANYRALWSSRFGIQCVRSIPYILQGHLGKVFNTLVLGAILSVVFAIWGLAPVVWTEIFPVKSSSFYLGDYSKRLGRWLTLGFFGLFVSGVVLYALTMFALPVISAASLLAPRFPVFEKFQVFNYLVKFTSFATLGGTGFAALFLVRGRLRKLVLGFRPILDMLLDVDNWFREHPRDSTPKARICGRYVSLLRYICNWKADSADDNSGYDGIVIIAHSQGTVITADLLRFLRRESGKDLPNYDPELQKLNELPIYLFTMGCPLRQLYGLRFPHLYHWARHDDQTAMASWTHGDIPNGQFPEPGELLGVRLWVNCYRSGDYVGRYLWRTDACEYAWNGDLCGFPPSSGGQWNSTDKVKRLEFCIGAGAHTHYFDRTAGIVAKELDWLISDIAYLSTSTLSASPAAAAPP